MTDYKELLDRLRAPTVSHHKVSNDWEEYETVRRERPAPPLNHEAADAIEALQAEREALRKDAERLEYILGCDLDAARQYVPVNREEFMQKRKAKIDAAIAERKG